MLRAMACCACLVFAVGCGGSVRSAPADDEGGATSSSDGAAGAKSSAAGSMSSAGGTGGQIILPVPCGKTFCDQDQVCCSGVLGTCAAHTDECPPMACEQPHEECRDLPPAPIVLSCAQELGVAADPYDTVNLLVPSAAVTNESQGASANGCLKALVEDSVADEQQGDELLSEATSLELSDGDRVWVVEVVVEGYELPSLVGQQVSLSYAFEDGEFSPTQRQLSLVSEQSASLGVWTAEGGDLPELGNVPLVLARGPAACLACDECGSYEAYGIDIVDPLSRTRVGVPHGQAEAYGPWVVVHGGLAQQTSSGGCADWYVAHAQVAILGRM
jgi:hypothetical protein